MSDDYLDDDESTRRLRSEQTEELPGLDAMSWKVAGASWVGLLRKNNQDSAFGSPRLVGVADGMGGEAAGDLASVVAVRRLLLADAHSPLPEALSAAVSDASADIADLVLHNPDLAGMGTTICAAAFDGNEMSFVHIGDSRAYQWRDGVLTQLTHDHSFVQQLIDQGQLTPELARVHPKRSLVLRIVNGTPISRPDRFVCQPRIGDRYLFCSDGVSSFVDPAVLVLALRSEELDQAVKLLLSGADDVGAPDNVTLVLVDIVAQNDELDKAPPQVWGAAEALHQPESEPIGDVVEQLGSWGVSVNPGQLVAPRPKKPRKRRRIWLRRLIAALLMVALVASGAFGARTWLDGQYFIGVVHNRAAIFQGAPYHLGPWYLSRVVVVSEVNLSDLPVYYADRVQHWRIRGTTLPAAEQSLAELKAKADVCVAARLDPSVPGSEDCP